MIKKRFSNLVIKSQKKKTKGVKIIPGSWNKSCSIYFVEYFIGLANLPNRGI